MWCNICAAIRDQLLLKLSTEQLFWMCSRGGQSSGDQESGGFRNLPVNLKSVHSYLNPQIGTLPSAQGHATDSGLRTVSESGAMMHKLQLQRQ